MRFDGKVAFITGAAGNLGRAVSRAFEDAGARVVAVDLDGAALQSAYGESNYRHLVIAADLLDRASIARAAERARNDFGAIDVLCNVAGGFATGPAVHETPATLWQRMFDLNAMSVVNTAAAIVPDMISRRRGSIVNVAAASSIRGPANTAAYAVAKNAVVRLTESMAAELRPYGVGVTCVMPTIIDTPQNREAMPNANTSQWTPPDAIADVILFLASEAAVVISGCAIPTSGRRNP